MNILLNLTSLSGVWADGKVQREMTYEDAKRGICKVNCMVFCCHKYANIFTHFGGYNHLFKTKNGNLKVQIQQKVLKLLILTPKMSCLYGSEKTYK